jgi:CBS domain-containing protein
MKTSAKRTVATRLVLNAETATELMTPNPISIGERATVKEAVAFLTDKGFSAAPVVDDAGRPVGVVSQTDIVIHDRNKVEYAPSATDYYAKTDLTTPAGEALPAGFQVENVDRTLVGDIMTPVVISVSPTDSPVRVVGEMVAMHIHRLFVVDKSGVLVGVISAFDVLRKLRADN